MTQTLNHEDTKAAKEQAEIPTLKLAPKRAGLSDAQIAELEMLHTDAREVQLRRVNGRDAKTHELSEEQVRALWLLTPTPIEAYVPRQRIGVMRAAFFIALGLSAGCGFILQCFGWAFDHEGVEWLAAIFFIAALVTVITGLLSRIRIR